MLRNLSLTPTEAARHGLEINKDGRRRSAFELLAHTGLGMDRLADIWPEIRSIPHAIAEQLGVDARYAPYVERQTEDVAVLRRDEAVALPADLDFHALPGLSVELQQKLSRHRPSTLAQAGKIDGMTPAALLLLLAHARKSPRRQSA